MLRFTANENCGKSVERLFYYVAVLPCAVVEIYRVLLLGMLWFIVGAAQGQSTNYALGTSELVVGPAAATNSVVLGVTPATGTWVATANTNWLHLNAADESGTGGTNVIFEYDANPGPTRSGTLTIAGQTLTVTQAGSTYVAAIPPFSVSSGYNAPNGVAVDGAGNVYFGDWGLGKLFEWVAASGRVTTLVSSGLNHPAAVALDVTGNVYIADSGDNAIKKWTAAYNTLTTLVGSGLSTPYGVAVDLMGNVYIADSGNRAVKKWIAAEGTVTTLVAAGLGQPTGLAVDVAGNVYIGDFASNALYELTPGNSNLTALVPSGLDGADGLAVDGSGNVYVADENDSTIEKWTAANKTVTTLVSSGLSHPGAVAVDALGNIYIADTQNGAVYGLAKAFVDTTMRLEGISAGSDALPQALPTESSLLSLLPPSSDQPWLNISSVMNGVVSFSFTANSTFSNRTAHIDFLGQNIPVTQPGGSFILGANSLLVGPNAGSDSVVLAAVNNSVTWSAAPEASWLHLSAANESGTGSTNLVFNFDANPGPTRSGSMSIGGQTLTVTQAGSSYVYATPTAIIPSVGPGPDSVAIDDMGNLYFGNFYGEEPDYPYGAISERTVSGATATLFSAEWDDVRGVAVDSAGNVYFSSYTDQYSDTVSEWLAASGTVTTLVSSGVLYPCGVALDGAGNVYIADAGDNAIKARSLTHSNLATIVSAGLNDPTGVALDAAGNIYIADLGDNAIKEWSPANSSLITLVSTNLNAPEGVAVDGSGNVYIADTGNNAIKEWVAASNTVITLISNLNLPGGVAVDGSGNVYVADTGYTVNSYYLSSEGNYSVVLELVRAFVDSSIRLETLTAGDDALAVVLPATESLVAPFAPVSHESWLSISGITNGVVSYTFSAAASNRTGYITMLGQTIPIAQGAEAFNYTLGTTSLLEGPGTGTDSVVLGVSTFFGPWTASANASWLHLDQSGSGGTNVVFTYDANRGETRSGTLSIAGQSVTITQAGSTYVQAGALTTLISNGLSYPAGVAVDGAGKVYVADYSDSAIYEWNKADNLVTTLVSSGLNKPQDVAVDGAGNVYIADTGDNAIKEWTPGNNQVTTLVSSGLYNPVALALDGAGNVYIADTYDDALKEWMPGNSQITTLISGLDEPEGVAVDGAGNVYIADIHFSTLWELLPSTGTVNTSLISGLSYPSGVAVDGSGNVFIAEFPDSAIWKWIAATDTVTNAISTGLSNETSVVVDSTGNIYIADEHDNAIKELPRAFVDPTPKLEGAAAGFDVLPVVLPNTENLSGPFLPSSDAPWLTVNGTTNGVVSYSFTATASNRTANLNVLGQSIPITQSTATFVFSTNALFEGSTAGSDSVYLLVNPNTAAWTATASVPWLHVSEANQSGVGSTNLVFTFDANPGAARSGSIIVGGQPLTVVQSASLVLLGVHSLWEGPSPGADSVVLSLMPPSAQWTATANAAWLHVSAANQSGAGPTNVVFSFDANPGATRTGTIAFVSQTLTITQAGSTYVPAGVVTALVASGLNAPHGLAVNGQGEVCVADTFNSMVKLWNPTNNAVSVLVSNGLSNPSAVAFDNAGKVYFADSGNNAIKMWAAATGNVTNLVSTGLNTPEGVALDAAGNVYIADTGNNAVKEWVASNTTVIPLVSAGLSYPSSVALDAAGNVYIADTGNNAIKEWMAATSNVNTLAFQGLIDPASVAVDGEGNVYVADTGNGAIKKWTVASNSPTALVSSGLSYPYGVAVDGLGNLYIADTDNQAIKELPRAFVDPTPKTENLFAGTDVLPVVLPAATDLLAPFAPISSQAWLTISGTTGGVVSFDFAADDGLGRTATISLLGQTIPVIQQTVGTPPTLGSIQVLGNGMVEFAFTNLPNAAFTILATTNLALPLSEWAVIGAATENPPGQYQFTDAQATNVERYYVVRSP